MIWHEVVAITGAEMVADKLYLKHELLGELSQGTFTYTEAGLAVVASIVKGATSSDDAPPKRRGRPAKAAEPVATEVVSDGQVDLFDEVDAALAGVDDPDNAGEDPASD